MRAFRFLLAIILLASVRPTTLRACSCGWFLSPGDPTLLNGQPLPTDEEIQAPPVVFVGEVLFAEDLLPPPDASGFYAYWQPVTYIRVLRDWSDSPLPEIVPISSIPSTCDFAFVVGRTYVIFPGVSDTGLTAHRCSRTDDFERAYDLVPFIEARRHEWPTRSLTVRGKRPWLGTESASG